MASTVVTRMFRSAHVVGLGSPTRLQGSSALRLNGQKSCACIELNSHPLITPPQP
jgi:hypothetical protein